MLIEKDINSNKDIALPRPLFFLTFLLSGFLIYAAISSALFNSNIEDKIMTIIVVLSFIYYGSYSLFFVVRGGMYVRSIKKEKELFTLANIFNKKKMFTFSEIQSIEASRPFFIEKLLTDFRSPIFNLILKGGYKYRITSETEHIDTLKNLLGNKNKES